MLIDEGRAAPLALASRITERTLTVLETVAREPGLSNRAVAERAGIRDGGQASRLLHRLRQLGLVVNDGHGRGSANAWRLTPLGRQAESLARRQRAWRSPPYDRPAR